MKAINKTSTLESLESEADEEPGRVMSHEVNNEKTVKQCVYDIASKIFNYSKVFLNDRIGFLRGSCILKVYLRIS